MIGRYRVRLAKKKLRRLIDRIEIARAGVFGCSDLLSKVPQTFFHPDIRLALVKQDVYQDLYCAPVGASGKELLVSSLHRSGPAGLLAAFRPDFYIVKTEADPECNIWREKATDCHQQTEEYYLGLKERIHRDGEYGHKVPQGTLALSSGDIDWSVYDFVICYDAAVPKRITKQFPNVTWCYYVGEPCMRSYKESEREPIQGYDLFLSQRFRRYRSLPTPMAHVVEFPYFAQFYGCFHKLLETTPSDLARCGVAVEGRSKHNLTDKNLAKLSTLGGVRYPRGSLINVLTELMASKYFLIGEGRKWGNAQVEAVACGCLTVGSPNGQHNVSLFTPNTTCHDFEESIECINSFESNEEAFKNEIGRQRALLMKFCWERPLKELISKRVGG
jgi:hypothetical protein